MIQANVIKNCIDFKVEKCLNLGSSCIYPKDYIQPLKEEYLLKDSLEKTNEGYSLAKIIGLKLSEYSNKQFQTNFISLMPSNLYGPYDHFDLENSHALAATILKVHNAVQNKESFVNVWGSGDQKREWTFVSDIVDCMLWAMNNLKNTETFLNVGTGVDITMNELTSKIMVEYYAQKDYHNLEIKNDTSKPNGMMEKRLDVTKINNLGWKAKVNLDEGIQRTIKYFLENHAK
jgi:GDP-L-fucose synthase